MISASVRLAVVTALVLVCGGRAATAAVTSFGSGSLIVPMDTGTAGQNDGMLRAYGLVYALLRHGVPVAWVIDPAKSANGDDFQVAGVNALQDVRTGATLAPRSYRGGPFVIAAADAAAALPVIQSWQATAGDQTAVHRVIGVNSVNADVAKLLIAAPRIAIVQDGNETIAFNDLNAAGIPDAFGNAWSSSSPDLLTETDIEGPTTTTDDDGALFTTSSLPRHCFFASMHYNTTIHTDEVVQEVRQWLDRSDLLHAYMQCEAARVFENANGGLYLTNAGLDDDGAPTTDPANRVPASPLTQLDGTFDVDTGAVDSMAAKPGGYKAGVTTLINDSSTSLLARITMMTGRLDGQSASGRVTYLAGHDYSLDLPITLNPQTNGVRLFLNALLTSDCATVHVQDDVAITKTAPAYVATSQIPYTITYSNPATSGRVAENLELTDVLPAGTTYLVGSAVPAPTTNSSGVLTWKLPPLAPGAQATVTFTVSATVDGSYSNDATLGFSHLTVGEVATAPAVTVRDTVPPSVSITGGPSGSTTDATPNFAFTMGGGAVSAQCAIDSVGFAACAPSPASYTAAPLTPGPHTFTVRVVDAAGNQASASRSFSVDVDAPVVAFADPPTNPVVTSDATPAFYFTTFGAGSATTYCSVAGDPFAPCTSPFTTRTLSDGNYTVSAYGVDGVGNTGPTDTFTFTIDSQAPVVSIPVPPNATTFATAKPTFTFGDVGPAGTAVTFACHFDASADVPCVSGFTAGSVLSDGSHTLTVTATDLAGNSGQASLGFVVDTAAPLVTIPGAPTNAANVASTTPTLFFQVANSPNTTPIVVSQCKVFDAAPPNALRASSGSSCDTLFTVPLANALTDGDYLFEVTAIDAAGNVGRATHSFAFTVDTSAPVVTVLAPPSPVATDDPTPSFIFSVEPGGTPVTTACRVYAPLATPPAAVACTSPYTVPTSLADGSFVFEVIATDAAGNVGSDVHAFTVGAAAPTPSPTATPPGGSLCGAAPRVCKAAGAAKLVIRNSAKDAQDKLDFSWRLGSATTVSELGDPSVDTAYAVCIWDAVAGTPQLVMEMGAPAAGNCAGRPCWRSTSHGEAFRYADKGGLPDGLQGLTVRSGPLGKASVVVKGRGAALPDPPMPFAHDPTITVQVVNSLGNCWGIDYVVAPRANDAARLVVEEKP